MIDKAEVWVSNYLAIKKHIEWSEFVIDLSARFKDDMGLSVVEQFNKLQQLGTIEEYIDEFDNLRSLMEQFHHVLPDPYMLESFIGGLKPAVKPFVKAFKPQTVTDAILYARLQEESIQANNQKFTKSSYTPKSSNLMFSANSNKSEPLLPTPQTKPLQTALPKTNVIKPFKFIPADVRVEKMAKGLCYYCDQQYERGHKCKFKEPQLFTVEIPCRNMEDSEEEDAIVEDEVNEPCISVNALDGSQGYSTMRVKGIVQD